MREGAPFLQTDPPGFPGLAGGGKISPLATTVPTGRASSPLVTDLLISWSNGDETALAQLVPLVHDELHRLASRQMRREREGHVLQTTALVNEAGGLTIRETQKAALRMPVGPIVPRQ
jgi:hypothetical protein